MIKGQVGRPKSELKELPNNWKEEILSLYDIGASDVEVKAKIYQWLGSFSASLWIRWLKEEPEFSTTIKTGKMLSQNWWEKNGRTNLTTKEFNTRLWTVNMNNRFHEDWKDRRHITNKDIPSDLNDLTDEELEAQLKMRMDAMNAEESDDSNA